MKYCTKCGAKLAEDDKFCPVCGAHQEAKEPNQSSTVYNPIIEEEKEQLEASSKSRAVAAILCFFFGGVGAHNFYVGKMGLGIMRIMLCGFILASAAFANGAKSMILESYNRGLISLSAANSEILVFSMPNYITTAANAIWTIVDFIMILLGKFKDVHGALVTEWGGRKQ